METPPRWSLEPPVSPAPVPAPPPPGADAFGRPRRSWLREKLAAGSALVSIGAYSVLWGWQFAIGFVVLLFIHEMGHVVALRREGIKASAPMFVPFMGAVVWARSLGDDALTEARVGLAGPVFGTAASAVVAIIGLATNT